MLKKESYVNTSERSPLNFDLEMQCMHLHMLKNNREHLKPLVKNVYMNKLKVKRYSPYIYAGERNEEYFNLRYF